MGKFLIRSALVFLAVVTGLSGVASAVDASADAVLRVGLYYDSNALPGANLENSVGSGYRLGYYEEDLSFHELGRTSETQISMVKTQNVTLSDGNYVDGTGTVTVGCYHLQLPGTYASFQEALDTAETLSDGFPAWIDGSYYVRSGAYTTKEAAEADKAALGLNDAEVVGTSGYAVSVVVTKTGEVLFQFDGGSALSLGVCPGLDDSVKTVTWFKGYRYYGGFQYVRDNGGNIEVINVVSLDDYVRGVLPYEMSNDWPLEALKAQAVCARTYAVTNTSGHRDFDVCASTHCQMYQGLNLSNERTDQAVDETAGEFVRYDGEPAITFYSASDGGATEDVRNIWNANADLPHLKGVVDPYEADVADGISQYHWSYTFTSSELTSKMNSSLSGKGYSFTGITDVYVSEYSETGNPASVTFVDRSGKTWSFGPETIRIALGLRSNRFDVTGGSGGAGYAVNDGSETLSSINGAYAVNGDGSITAISGTPYVITSSGTEQLSAPTASASSSAGSGSFTFAGSGYGHNVGMSQQGARAMALRGMDYIDILTFYFSDVEIW
ncbi:SpoIID/LytB domain-containing protein [uncultured Intestinimonas sp.]|uniref:SpoIID/LytB domain-containing protein n=1 Tax=uncultured Intestinimonas sp. TaxID=1689265 RepID=UPI0025CCF339|nr:SpoIID/LytB domain-containing protein [uncultured Intestinimonas sp.]